MPRHQRRIASSHEAIVRPRESSVFPRVRVSDRAGDTAWADAFAAASVLTKSRITVIRDCDLVDVSHQRSNTFLHEAIARPRVLSVCTLMRVSERLLSAARRQALLVQPTSLDSPPLLNLGGSNQCESKQGMVSLKKENY